MSLTDDQLRERRAYLGGTDAAALAGVNPPAWSQPIDVYLDKVGLAPARSASAAMSLGSRLEPVVADLFTEATGIGLRRRTAPVRSRQYPWAGGHLDRMAADGAVFEAKWAMRSDGWGDSWRREHLEEGVWLDPPAVIVPPHYDVQVQHYLAVTGRGHAYLAVLLGYGDFRWYRIARRQGFIDKLMELEERFWHDHVLAQVPPDPDGSAAYGKHLRRSLPSDAGTEAVATPEQLVLAHRLQHAKESLAEAQRVYDREAQALQLSMGDNAKLVGPDFTISWKQQAPALRVRWEQLATRLAMLGWAYAAGDPEGDPQLAAAQQALVLDTWPTKKKDQAALVRQVAQELELASYDEQGARPFLATFDSDEEGSDAE